MLYDYKFTLAQMGQIKNYKKENKFNHILLHIEDIELSTISVDCKIKYKKTIPLNMFEKYALRLIDRADEIYSDMNIPKIAKLLHLDENLVKESLENLEAIDMINGINSDIITINKDENSIYLQYENKFKEESSRNNYFLTKNEFKNIDNYILDIFKQNIEDNDKKYINYEIIEESETIKNATMLNYSNNKFLILSNDGINKQNDLKFIESNVFTNNSENIVKDIFCHYDEFLPLLRDKLFMNKDNLILIGSTNIDKNNLDVLKANKTIEDTFILSNSNEKHNRIFDIIVEDFFWIGDELYIKENEYIIKSKNNTFKRIIKNKLNNYFIDKILEIEPNYNIKKLDRLNKLIENVKDKVSECKFQTKKEFDDEVKKINTDKNKLYGSTSKKSKARIELRKKIDKLEEKNSQDELNKYPEYIKNRNKILNLKKEAVVLEKEKEEIVDLESELNKLNHEKSLLISKDNKSKIVPIEKELKKLERLKI